MTLSKPDIYHRVLDRKNSTPQKRIGLKVIFIAQKDDIASALKRGCSILSIWELLHEERNFEGSYKTFCSYVAKYIVKEGHQSKPQISAIPPSNPKKKFDWTPNYNPEDLL
jgi:hypothetical protein